LVYVRMNVMGEFRISYSKLGPTEVRVLAILLNTFMYFGGLYRIKFSLGSVPLSISPYDLAVACITLLIIYFFADTGIKQAIALRNLKE
jgi:archaetidylinositol phosphate synthase